MIKQTLELTEFDRLRRLLERYFLPYEIEVVTTSYVTQYIIYIPRKVNWVSMATISDPWSLGVERGLLEQHGLVPKDHWYRHMNCEGYLTATDIFNRWKKYYPSIFIDEIFKKVFKSRKNYKYYNENHKR